jgi:hypothetical protein
MPKKQTVVSTTIVPDKLKSKDLSLYVHAGGWLHFGVYGDNTARIWQASSSSSSIETEEEQIKIYLSKSATSMTLIEDGRFTEVADRLLAMLELCEEEAVLLSKEDAIAFADVKDLPSKLRYKREGKMYWCADYEVFTWENSSYHLIFCPFNKNILSFVIDQPPLPSNVEIYSVAPSGHTKSWQQALARLVMGEERLCCDIETYDVDLPKGPGGLIPWLGRIRSIQIYAPVKKKVVIFDLGARYEFEGYCPLFIAALYEALRTRKLIWHNALFDLGFLHHQFGLDFWHTQLFCTMVMSQNVWAGIKFIPHGLGAVAARCGLEIDKGLQTSDFGGPLTAGQWVYGANDTIVTYGVYQALVKKLKYSDVPTNLEFALLDCEYLHVAHLIRTKGMFVSDTEIAKAKTLTAFYYNTQAAKWKEDTGFVPTVSSQKLIPFLQKRGHSTTIQDPKNKNKTKDSANKAIIKEAAKTDSTIVSLVNAKFAKKRLELVNHLAGMSQVHKGKIICGLRVLASQGLGRTSSSKLVRGTNAPPTMCNAHNVPTFDTEYPSLPDLRAVFVAPSGYKYVGIDLSSAHLRLAAYFSGCEAILSKMQPGEDVHCYNASMLVAGTEGEDHPLASYTIFLATQQNEKEKALHLAGSLWNWDELKDLSKRYRDIAKTAIYTAINLGGAARLQYGLKLEGIVVTLEQSKDILTALWAGIPEIKEYVFAEQAKALSYEYDFKGKDYTLYGMIDVDGDEDEDDELEEEEEGSSSVIEGYCFLQAPQNGRSRYLPKYKSTYANGKSQPRINDVSSFIWMSRESDIMKRAQVRFLREYLLPNNLLDSVWIANFVHDEVVLNATEEKALTAAAELGKVIKEEWKKVCPVVEAVEGKPKNWVANSWADIH